MDQTLHENVTPKGSGNEEERIMIVLNKNSDSCALDLARFGDARQGVDIVRGGICDLTSPSNSGPAQHSCWKSTDAILP